MSKTFYITTTLPYVNANLHIGHALEIVRADVLHRYKKQNGFDTFFNTGTDEHGMKIYEKSIENKKDPKKFVDDAFLNFKEQLKYFGVSSDINYIRTTDKKHIIGAQAFWNKVNENGYIYKKNYKTKYCVGCEEEKTDSDLENGRCRVHPNRELEIIEEENYFFAFSKFQDKLLDFYAKNPRFVVPQFRYNEIISFVKRGLQDFSISRLKSKMPWGIEVPQDKDHVMYVWFDALTNYITTLGWGSNDESNFEKFWINGTPLQYCGKDNTRFQAVMWQAMLMACGILNTDKIIVNGHITADGGIKMSKSLGNVVDPMEVSKEYGVDALRYFLLKEISSFEDSPFTIERFKESYNSGLANGLGNLVSRIMKMAEDTRYEVRDTKYERVSEEYKHAIENFDLQKAMNIIWQKIGEMDKKIQDTKPFSLVKGNLEEKNKGVKIIEELVSELYEVSLMLYPFLPETSLKIKELIKANRSPEKPLFARRD
jgi:methionyl-tRNA synthetase